MEILSWYIGMFESLESIGDSKKAVEMAAYMKNKFPFLGIQRPSLDKTIKPYLKEALKEEKVDWEFVDVCWAKKYREAQYVGAEYLYCVRKKLIKKDLNKIKKLVKLKSWWDVTDSLDEIVAYLVLTHPELKTEMLKWAKDENIWIRRIAINHQLQWKENTDTELLEEIILINLGSKEFFINKAIGWSLRDYSKVNPEWVRSFIIKYENHLSKLSIKEASKYL